MINNDRTAHVVRAWLVESVEPPRVPEYLPDLISRTARTSQRPAWTLPERWIGMATLARVQTRFALVPWRTLAVLALLIALIGSALAVSIGGSNRLPKPFGPAANGLIAYSHRGDIVVADPATGDTRLLSGGPTADIDPFFSRDGSMVAFRSADRGNVSVVVMRPDGSERRTLQTPASVTMDPLEFSHDGRSLLVLPDGDTGTKILLADIGGGPPRTLVPDPGIVISYARWLPSAGNQIVFVGQREREFRGLYLLDADTRSHRPLVEPGTLDLELGPPSPDGTGVAFVTWREAPGFTARIHVVSIADGSVTNLPTPQGVAWQIPLAWANDGERLVVARGYTGGFDATVLAVIRPHDRSATGVETPLAAEVMRQCCALAEWAPDDGVILVTPIDQTSAPGQQLLMDPATGAIKPAPWPATAPGSWQRLAP